MGMTAHLVFKDIDSVEPVTHSKLMMDLIRNDISFDGLLMTDDISMNALEGDVVARAQKAWAVGCDLVLHCNGNLGEMRLLATISEYLGDQAMRRAKHMISKRPKSVSVDIWALKEEFDALMNE
jgi:beta-N-acetylhexosaminidase